MTILLCMGTRPEIIKMAPVVKALKRRGLGPVVLHTGQHDEMAWPLYEFFGIRPEESIRLTRTVAGLSGLGAELLGGIDAVLERTAPRAALVHGDTSSAAMGALAAFNRRVPVGHVEAGLRSGNKAEPFPEEMNRQLIGRIAQWHFAPTAGAVSNLQGEGVRQDVFEVGNTAVDAARWASDHLEAMERTAGPRAPARAWFAASGCTRLGLVTAHRRENWGAPMRSVLAGVRRVLEMTPDLAVVWPVHLNPLVKEPVEAFHAALPAALARRWLLTDPLHYPELIDLMRVCHLLLTDSGGIQEEAVALDKPVLILRNQTERPEVIECGLGRLTGTDTNAIVAASLAALDDGEDGSGPRLVGANPFGDGRTGERIAEHLAARLGARRTEAAVEAFA